MTAITEILAISESVGIKDHRFIGQVISRNQRINTSEQMSVVPFEFKMKPMNYLYYSQNRELLSSLRFYDRAIMQYLNFGETGWAGYIKYQGDMSEAEISACLWQPASANKLLVLGNLPSIDPTDYIVKVGDFCQVGLYSYIATESVQRGSGTTVNIPVHRNLIAAVTVQIPAVMGELGTTVSMGGNVYTGVTFQVILTDYPTYTLIPIANDSFVSWAGEFTAMEAVL
jgi:hypothetical protein